MTHLTEPRAPSGPLQSVSTVIGGLLIAFLVPLATFVIMWQLFGYLRTAQVPQLVLVVVAILWGVGGIAALFLAANWLVDRFPETWAIALRPFIFVGPAIAILIWYLALPTLRTLYFSFFNANSTQFVGLDNFVFALRDPAMLESFQNNLIWLVVGTALSVAFGLLIAVLADRSPLENFAKSMIFLPMAISFVGAGVIWRFIYFYKPPGVEQIGLLNALFTLVGGEPQAWLTVRPWNNYLLVAIMVWLQTGYAMVLLSAALKGVPAELLEAGRIDGGNEVQIFFRIIVPYIRGTILTVTTTVVIFSLKVFDIVFVMTNGNYGTEVMATQFYRQMFRFQHFGRGAAVAIVLLLAVTPVVIYNLRQFREREAFS